MIEMKVDLRVIVEEDKDWTEKDIKKMVDQAIGECGWQIVGWRVESVVVWDQEVGE